MRPGSIAIVGAAETEQIGTVPELSTLGLHADAALRALEDAGLGPADVDGIATSRVRPVEAASYLGLAPRWLDGTMVGGCSPMLHIRHAAAAIAAGHCETVLVCHGESGRSGIGHPKRVPIAGAVDEQFEVPYGAWPPPLSFTTPALRFLEDRGMGREHLAHVVVAQRKWARDNPRALRRKQVTVAEVLAAPMVAYPFTKDMCCPVTDGGGAVVLVRAERAPGLDLSSPPVYLLGAGESSETAIVSQMEDLSSFGAFRRAARAAFDEARLGTGDVDHLMVYDAFAHIPLYGLEDLGFVGHAESGDFIAEGRTSPGGELPLNTNGGGLCYTHTGAYGMFAIQESVRQLRGQAAVQVDHVEVSFVQGIGMMFGAAGSLLLSNRQP